MLLQALQIAQQLGAFERRRRQFGAHVRNEPLKRQRGEPITHGQGALTQGFTAHFAGLRGYGGGSFRDVLDPPRDGVRERSERDADLAAVEDELAALAREWQLLAPDPRGEAA